MDIIHNIFAGIAVAMTSYIISGNEIEFNVWFIAICISLLFILLDAIFLD